MYELYVLRMYPEIREYPKCYILYATPGMQPWVVLREWNSHAEQYNYCYTLSMLSKMHYFKKLTRPVIPVQHVIAQH